MSSTEQKNVTQPFIDSCYAFGILPTILSNSFGHPTLETDALPFEGLGSTPSLGARLLSAEDPLSDARRIFPVLTNAKSTTRDSPLLLKLSADCRTYSGNQAVLRMVYNLIVRRWRLHFMATPAIRHARRNTVSVCSALAPGAYGQIGRTDGNIRKLAHREDGDFYRVAADVFEAITKAQGHGFHNRKLRQWCHRNRDATGFKSSYRKQSEALAAYRNYTSKSIYEAEDPPSLKQKWIRTEKRGHFTFDIYYHRDHYYFKIRNKLSHLSGSFHASMEEQTKSLKAPKRVSSDHELLILSERDMRDLCFMLHALSNVRTYWNRRLYDITDKTLKQRVQKAQTNLWNQYVEVLRMCSLDYSLRNKLGVYFDVLQWRYLAWKSGDVFYDHSHIMAQKIVSKGLTTLPDQGLILHELMRLPMDISVDMLGIYKASMYPEVDPFKVVCDQYRLHMSRHQTDWQPGTEEYDRFEDTRAYMWYLGVSVLHTRNNIWPGRIREGASFKDWHARYPRDGIPTNNWRDAHDVDLTSSVVVADITDEQYMKQQDSACAPPLASEYSNYEAIRTAPRRHRRKLLYAVSEPGLPSLSHTLETLNDIGATLPDGYVGKVDFDPEFTTDIVTGSRCERHKDAPRPFYAASPPWGCILSYFDGITRDFLNSVPQSMLGKSTRQKFMDMKSITKDKAKETHTFYMSDDKAKYSPRMDPKSQQLPAEFFAEVFNLPGMRAYGPVMYHCELYYRVVGHLVHYNSNGTDREGMRGASNTWLEIVAQGLSTRLCREKGLVRGKSTFLAFIDDGLRKFSVENRRRTDTQCLDAARLVIKDVIFGLRVLGRELSWDKTFISRELFVILNEIVYDASFISSGLKSYCTAGDIEKKEVMSAADYEQVYFGKMRGAHGVGAPLDLCHYTYVFETLMSHFKMGADLQDNKLATPLDYRLFCITPVAFGGGGVRSMMQMACNEVANSTKEGIGNLIRFGSDFPILMECVMSILNNPLERLDPVDFMREPEQVHVTGPRIRSQRVVAEVRKSMLSVAGNDQSRMYMVQDVAGMSLLRELGGALLEMGDVSAEDIRLLYAMTPVSFIDNFIQKLASSSTLAELLNKSVIKTLRRMVRVDLRKAVNYFGVRCRSQHLLEILKNELDLLAILHQFTH